LGGVSVAGNLMGATHVEINPETTWARVKKWPSAVLAELAIRIQAELRDRAEARKENLSGDKGYNPEQKPKAHKATGHRPPPQRGNLRGGSKLDQKRRK
jgi:hypothetical protein